MTKLKIFLADLMYLNRYTMIGATIPINVGYIAAYTRKLFGSSVSVSVYRDPDALIADAAIEKPDVVGFGDYCWNSRLNAVVMDRLQAESDKPVTFVVGGPSVDTDPLELAKLFDRLPHLAAAIPNEGELAFANLVRALLQHGSLPATAIDGVVLRGDQSLVIGNLTAWPDPKDLPSPYLEGILDQFLDGRFQPLVQTLRGCPYTCVYCVSGRSRPKIRPFRKEQIKEELTFISKRFSDHSHIYLNIVDDNFGLFEQDIEIAKYIRHLSDQHGYPRSVYFFNDKRFTDISRAVLQAIGDINGIGLNISLQTETPEALKAINRVNLSSQQIADAVAWASDNGLETTTELIFGLPGENRVSFVAQLERAVDRGFDSVLCHNLFILQGSELNRQHVRDHFQIESKWRLPGPNYGLAGDRFVNEAEEVVTGSSTFSFKDYMAIREVNFMFYAIFAMRWFRTFFLSLRHLGISLSTFCQSFLDPDEDAAWPEEYLRFLADLKASFAGELFDSPAELSAATERMFREAGDQVVAPTRINVNFGARLIYEEVAWVPRVLREHLLRCGLADDQAYRIAGQMLDLSVRERIDLRNPDNVPESLVMDVDVIAWGKTRHLGPLADFRRPTRIEFLLDDSVKKQIADYNASRDDKLSSDYFYGALDMINPRSRLLFRIGVAGQAS